jgi:hypothetical protein
MKEKYVQIIISSGSEYRQNANGENEVRIVNPILALEPVVFPTLYTMTATVLLVGVDLTGEEVMEIRVIAPSGNLVFSTGKINSPDIPVNSNITLNFELKNLLLGELGKHMIELEIEGETLSTTPFFVGSPKRA